MRPRPMLGQYTLQPCKNLFEVGAKCGTEYQSYQPECKRSDLANALALLGLGDKLLTDGFPPSL